jgi:cyclopropane fatty-acyl-phospholipid synthase-like methyltransferase
MKTQDYYDAYAARQVRVGINERHRAIQSWLKQFGLRPGHDVLELGCGVGTQTELIAADLQGSGRLLAVDLSPRSVELARARLSGRTNVEFIAGDAVELELDRMFDVIVMPDVIEHIPLERHGRLFINVRRWLKDSGFVLIHMPSPLYQEWCHRHRPDLLQIVDQAIHAKELLDNVEPSGLVLHYLNTYSIWVPEGDYQVVVLKPRVVQDFTLGGPPPSLRRRILAALRRIKRRVVLGGAAPGSQRGRP